MEIVGKGNLHAEGGAGWGEHADATTDIADGGTIADRAFYEPDVEGDSGNIDELRVDQRTWVLEGCFSQDLGYQQI